MFFAPKIFLGCAPEILDRHYKIRPGTDHVQNFTPVGPRVSEISLSEKNIKNKKKSGLKHKSAPKAIAFGRTNK